MSSGFESDPLVQPHPHGHAFWRATAEGVFLLPRCRACGRSHWYPRPFCPFCHAEAIEWEVASGFGSVEAFTSVLRATPTTIVAYVKLEEGPVMLTNLVHCELEALRIGDRVRVAFQAAPEGRAVPVFAPVNGNDHVSGPGEVAPVHRTGR